MFAPSPNSEHFIRREVPPSWSFTDINSGEVIQNDRLIGNAHHGRYVYLHLFREEFERHRVVTSTPSGETRITFPHIMGDLRAPWQHLLVHRSAVEAISLTLWLTSEGGLQTSDVNTSYLVRFEPDIWGGLHVLCQGHQATFFSRHGLSASIQVANGNSWTLMHQRHLRKASWKFEGIFLISSGCIHGHLGQLGITTSLSPWKQRCHLTTSSV